MESAQRVYTFSGQFSAPVPLSATSRYNALADLLLGYPSSYTVQTTPFSPHLSYTAMGYYIRDDWRVTDSLTANVGLRWEYFGRPGGSGNNPPAGKIVSASDFGFTQTERVIQLGLKYSS